MTNEDIKLIFDALDRMGVPEEDTIRIVAELDILVDDEPIFVSSHPVPLVMCPCCGSTFVINQYGCIMRYCPNCGKAIKVTE